MHTHRLSCKALGNSACGLSLETKIFLGPLCKVLAMLIDLGGAVVGRDGLKAKGVAHNERLGSLEMSLMWRLWRRFSRRVLLP